MAAAWRTSLSIAYVLAIPVALIAVLAIGFGVLAEVEELIVGEFDPTVADPETQKVLTVYGSPVTALFAAAAAGPLVLLSYLVYWLVRFVRQTRRRRAAAR